MFGNAKVYDKVYTLQKTKHEKPPIDDALKINLERHNKFRSIKIYKLVYKTEAELPPVDQRLIKLLNQLKEQGFLKKDLSDFKVLEN